MYNSRRAGEASEVDACSGERQVDGAATATVNLPMALRQGMQYAVVWLAIRVDAHCGGRPVRDTEASDRSIGLAPPAPAPTTSQI